MTAALNCPSEAPLLQLCGLSIDLTREGQPVHRLIPPISLALEAGKNYLLVGPSGSGKTSLAKAMLRLLPMPPFRVSGEIIFDGMDLMTLPEGRMAAIRGKDISLMLQDSAAALNPLLQVGTQIAEGAVAHGLNSWKEARSRALDSLRQLGFEQPEWVFRSKPAVLSGGMKQRACLAMSLLLSPRLLILDEPTADLDYETKQEVLAAVEIVQRSIGCTLLWLTHDPDVMRHHANAKIFQLGQGQCD
jgi:ABC-type glutathione transport system ATPase component